MQNALSMILSAPQSPGLVGVSAPPDVADEGAADASTDAAEVFAVEVEPKDGALPADFAVPVLPAPTEALVALQVGLILPALALDAAVAITARAAPTVGATAPPSVPRIAAGQPAADAITPAVLAIDAPLTAMPSVAVAPGGAPDRKTGGADDPVMAMVQTGQGFSPQGGTAGPVLPDGTVAVSTEDPALQRAAGPAATAAPPVAPDPASPPASILPEAAVAQGAFDAIKRVSGPANAKDTAQGIGPLAAKAALAGPGSAVPVAAPFGDKSLSVEGGFVAGAYSATATASLSSVLLAKPEMPVEAKRIAIDPALLSGPLVQDVEDQPPGAGPSPQSDPAPSSRPSGEPGAIPADAKAAANPKAGLPLPEALVTIKIAHDPKDMPAVPVRSNAPAVVPAFDRGGLWLTMAGGLPLAPVLPGEQPPSPNAATDAKSGEALAPAVPSAPFMAGAEVRTRLLGPLIAAQGTPAAEWPGDEPIAAVLVPAEGAAPAVREVTGQGAAKIPDPLAATAGGLAMPAPPLSPPEALQGKGRKEGRPDETLAPRIRGVTDRPPAGEAEAPVAAVPAAVTSLAPPFVEFEAQPVDPTGLAQSGSAPVRNDGATATAPTPAAAPPQPVQSQIVAAMGGVDTGVTELLLSPEELGSVRIEMRTEGGSVVMMLSAERQDTQDLLRRHADRLIAEMRAAGFAEASVGFGQWSSGSDRQSGHPQYHAAALAGGVEAAVEPAPPAQMPRAQASLAAAGLYLRI